MCVSVRPALTPFSVPAEGDPCLMGHRHRARETEAPVEERTFPLGKWQSWGWKRVLGKVRLRTLQTPCTATVEGGDQGPRSQMVIPPQLSPCTRLPSPLPSLELSQASNELIMHTKYLATASTYPVISISQTLLLSSLLS